MRARRYGGDVLKFAGDAVLFMFTVRGDVKATDGTTGVLLRKAMMCAEELLGSGVVLEEGMTLHAGISVGPAHFLILGGGPRAEWTYLLQASAPAAT